MWKPRVLISSVYFIDAPLDVFLQLLSRHLGVDENLLGGLALPRDELEAVYGTRRAEGEGEVLAPPFRLGESSWSDGILVW